MFDTRVATQDLTVRHAWLLMKIYGPRDRYRPPQSWLQDIEDIHALQQLRDLYMVDFRDGVFFRTFKGQEYIDRLYDK